MSDKQSVDEEEKPPADLFLAFKKRMNDRWQRRNERYLKKLKQEKAEKEAAKES
jgi:hypothetical protein